MRRIIETDLKKPPAPHSWAILSNGTLYSVHVPIRPDGSIEDGGGIGGIHSLQIIDLRQPCFESES